MNSMGLRQNSLLFWALLACIWIGSAAIADESQLTVREFAEIYVSVATSDPFNAQKGFTGIRKFSADRPVEIIGALRRSVYSDARVAEEVIGMLAELVEHISLQSTGNQFIYYNYDETLEQLALSQRGARVTSQQVTVIFGTKTEFLEISDLISTHPNEKTRMLYESRVAMEERACFAVLKVEKKSTGLIEDALVFAEYYANDDEELVIQCLYDSIFQALGLGGASVELADGVFVTDSHGATRPTSLDWDMFAIHTNQQIRAGINSAEAKAAAEQIVTILKLEHAK